MIYFDEAEKQVKALRKELFWNRDIGRINLEIEIE